MLPISNLPSVWTSSPLVDHESFKRRVLRALPFQGRCQDGLYSLDGKIWHWQNSTLCFSVMTDQVLKKEEDPKQRFERLRRQENASPSKKIIDLREKIKNHFREISIDYVSLLDDLDDYETILQEYQEKSSYLLHEETDNNTKLAQLDYILYKKIKNSFVVECAQELNEEIKLFEGMQELISPAEIKKGEAAIDACMTLLRGQPFNETEFYKNYTELHQLIINIPFRKQIKSLVETVKQPLESEYPSLKQRLKNISGDDQINILQKAIHSVRIVRVVKELERQKMPENRPHSERVKISIIPVLFTLAKLKTIYDLLKTLPSMKVENVDAWFYEVKEKISQEDFEQASVDIQLMEKEFIHSNKRALDQLFERFKKVVGSMQEFHIDSFIRELQRSLKAGKSRQEIMDKWVLSNPDKRLLNNFLDKFYLKVNEEIPLDQLKNEMNRLHRRFLSSFRQIHYLISHKDLISAYYKLLKINEIL